MEFCTNEDDNRAVRLIESLDKNSDEKFISSEGYYLDLCLAELLKKPRFLAGVLQQFLAFSYQKNFEIREKAYESHKRKLIKFMIKMIKQYPVLDVALVVFMRSKLAMRLRYEEIMKSGAIKFGKEPEFKFSLGPSEEMQIKIIIIDIGRVIIKKYGDYDQNIVLGFWDNGFRIVYDKTKAKILVKPS